MNNYSNEWVNNLNKKITNCGVLLHKPNCSFKVGDVVKFTFDDTIGQIKGFYFCNISNSVCAILGKTPTDFLSMSVSNLTLANEIECKVFQVFAPIEGITQLRNRLLINI